MRQLLLRYSGSCIHAAAANWSENMKNYLFVMMLGYMSVFSNTVYSNVGNHNGSYDHIDYSREPILWGLYDGESLMKTVVALFSTGLVVFWVTPHACIGAVTGYCIYSGSPHVRALRGALIHGGISACVYSPVIGVSVYKWSRGDVERDY